MKHLHDFERKDPWDEEADKFKKLMLQIQAQMITTNQALTALKTFTYTPGIIDREIEFVVPLPRNVMLDT